MLLTQMYLIYYNVLITLQDALANCVSSQLRAINFDIDEKKRVVFFKFFYESEITYELEDHVSTFLVEVDTCTKEHYMHDYEIIQLDLSKPVPIEGKLAFLRYEKILPKFVRKKESRAFLLQENFPHHAVFRLDMQEALLGRVTSALRHVSVNVDPEKKRLIAHFVYDGEISELNYQLAADAIQDSKISFSDFEMESFIERVDYPNQMIHHGQWLAYWRQEWIYKGKDRIPAIKIDPLR